MAVDVTLAALRAKADISRGGTSLLRGYFLLLRKQGTTTYRIVENISGTYDAGGTSAVTAHRARATDVATIGTATAHGLTVGRAVKISGVSGTGYNCVATVLSVPDTTHFTYANDGDDEGETPDTGGATVVQPCVMWSGTYTVAASEPYDRVLLAGSVGAYAVADLTTMQAVVAGTVTAPVVDPTDTTTCVLGWADVTPTAFTIGQKSNPQIICNEASN